MNVSPPMLQNCWTTTRGAEQSLARLAHYDRGPGWIRVLDAGRTSRTWTAELDTRARQLDGANRAAEGGDGADAAVAKAADYLRGAAWHGNRALDAVASAVSDTLSGHAELQTAAARLLDVDERVDMGVDSTTFESAVKRVDPGLLDRIGAAGTTAGASELALADRDISAAQNVLRGIAQRFGS